MNTRLEYFNTTIAVITLLVTAVGLFAISRQLEQSQASLLSNTSEHMYARMHDIHKVFIERPHLRAYFYQNIPAPRLDDDADRYHEVMGATEMLCDFFHQVLVELDTVPEDDRKYSPEMYEDLYSGWTAYIKDVYKRSPAFRAYYKENRNWYTSNLAMALFGEAEKELAAAQPVTGSAEPEGNSATSAH